MNVAHGCVMNVAYGLLRLSLFIFLMESLDILFRQVPTVEIPESFPITDEFFHTFFFPFFLLFLPILACYFMVIFRLRFARLYIFCGVTLLVGGGCLGVLWLVISDSLLWSFFYCYILFTVIKLLLARCCCVIGPPSPRCLDE